MWPTYRAAIAQHLGAKLSEDEAARLASLLGKLTSAPTPARTTGARRAFVDKSSKRTTGRFADGAANQDQTGQPQ